MSAEALSKVQPAWFPGARHGSEDALPASLASEDRGRITQRSLHHFSGLDRVRLAAAKNPNATEPVFRCAALDKDERVCKAVAFTEKASTITRTLGAIGV